MTPQLGDFTRSVLPLFVREPNVNEQRLVRVEDRRRIKNHSTHLLISHRSSLRPEALVFNRICAISYHHRWLNEYDRADHIGGRYGSGP